MDRNSPVSEVMTTEVLTFAPGDTVEDAIRTLVDRGVDGAPVVDEDGVVVGMLSNGDLIVRETELHFPTLISVLGASIEVGHRRFDEELHKALGSRVDEVMTDEPVLCGPDDSIEHAATLMHDHDVSRIPVVDDDGRLLGIVARNDVLRAILAGG